MTVKAFKKILVNLLESDGDFVTDTIDMRPIVANAKKAGLDDAVYVAGENHNEVFVLMIQKI